MPRSFSAKDVNSLVSLHKGILQDLEEPERLAKTYKDNIDNAVKSLANREIWIQLREIPIDEINRNKSGFRIKPLKEYGYNTIADIAGASVSNIASVRGISEDGARQIYNIVRNIVNQTAKNTKIRLSLDDKSDEATMLVEAVSKYRQIQPTVDKANKLLLQYKSGIENAIKDIKPGQRRLLWYITSNAKKQKSDEAFIYLTDILQSDYKSKASEIKDETNRIVKLQASDAWSDFSDNSIRFSNIIENVAPGTLGEADSVYGLPEELAREIRDECFFPEGLLCELRRYQEWGVKYTLHQGKVLLGDEMGLGKTVQAIATMVSLKNTGATHFVVVCPASVISNWCREIRKHSRLSVTRIHGQGKETALSSWIKTGGVAVTTYETTGIFKLNPNFRFTLLVVDEAHYIKNPDARRTVNVKAIAAHAERMLFMTGTALENKVDEMISLIQILQPQIANQLRGISYLSAAPEFRRRVAPVYFRRKREDVLTELPELIDNQEWCTMGPEEERVYEQAVLGKHYAEARRVSWSVDDLRYSSKAKRLVEIIEDAEDDDRKVIVFSFFLDTINKVCELLGNKCMKPINGSVSPNRRQQIIDDFEKAPAGAVLPAQIQAGGTGLNIQTASVVILCEPQLKPSIENQAISRAYRMGQTRNVLVYRLLCENTVDEKITVLLDDKQKIFDAFADESVAAKNTLNSENAEVDDKTFGNIIQEEIDRINAKNGVYAS